MAMEWEEIDFHLDRIKQRRRAEAEAIRKARKQKET